MNEAGSIVEFFYNVIPGSLFLFALQYPCILNLSNLIHSSDTLTIFAYVVISLGLGFLFQGFTIVLRHRLKWNVIAYRYIAAENYKRFLESYKKVTGINVLGEKDLDKNLSNEEMTQIFYGMDCALRGSKPPFLPTHFSSLFAFWANIFFAASALLLIIWIREQWSILLNFKSFVILVVLLLIISLSFYFADKFLKSFYGTILNCYYMKFIKGQIDNIP